MAGWDSQLMEYKKLKGVIEQIPYKKKKKKADGLDKRRNNALNM